MKKYIVALGASAATLVAPLAAFAQSGKPTLRQVCSLQYDNLTATEIACKIYGIINIVIPLLILAAVAFFIFSIFKYIQGGGENEEARSGMINSIIGFAVILGLWGLVTLLLRTFGIPEGGVAPDNLFPTF